ncbi:MAG: hypothetical protein H8D45_28565, partial [Bacteroidetes bacterium]|nr:hypothetical protein [Bacteroidota bacterium]
MLLIILLKDINDNMNIPDLRIIEFQGPLHYMRTHYPELFSDSKIISEPILTESLLGYHLDTLTNRKQELEFESFATRLVELEICPNIKPQTGPVGGGDGGFDASTYPVSPELSERTWWGNPNPPTDEKWAFAISCKKKWTDKVHSDIKKIYELDENFSKVFFITNQYARAATRGKKEKELGEEYDFEVHILDRTWIITKVLENKHEEMTIELLDLKVEKRDRIKWGPLDTSRNEELENLEKKLGDPKSYYGNDFLLARDYFKAATLARGLEKPRATIEGLFVRSFQIAEKVGLSGQIIEIGYEYAWTCFWWFEDYESLNRIYGEIEEYLNQTDDSYDCEYFLNLWMLLFGAVNGGILSSESVDLSNRINVIKKWLDENSQDESRPNNALFSKILSRTVDLIESIGDSDEIDDIFKAIIEDLEESEGLVTFPFMKIINRFINFGQFFSKNEGYNLLFETIEKLSIDRTSENQRGELFYIRGVQCLENDQLELALKYLGQARVLLAKEETIVKSIRASYGCSIAYFGLEHHWAAKMEALISVFLSTSGKTLDSMQFLLEHFLAIKLLCWEELRLGQIRSFSQWYRYNLIVLDYLEKDGHDCEKFKEELMIQDCVLGCFLLNISDSNLNDLKQIQNRLESNGLFMSELCLKYRNQGFQGVQEEFPEELSAEEKIYEYFYMLKQNPASAQIPAELTDEFKEYKKIDTEIMGIKYIVTTRNFLGTILISENLLGVIEAALCLAKWENFAFIVDEIHFLVDIHDSGNNPPLNIIAQETNPDGYFLIWKPDVLEYIIKSPKEIRDFFHKFFFKILLDSTIDPKEDLQEEFERLHSEHTFSRAMSFTPTGIMNLTILG